ncbi:hypothetical protein VCHA53O466_50136 [Vibrio chagasii]|nr:hypothetical protein VCHA53O466_50136 [Vibrio chagasii]
MNTAYKQKCKGCIDNLNTKLQSIAADNFALNSNDPSRAKYAVIDAVSSDLSVVYMITHSVFKSFAYNFHGEEMVSVSFLKNEPKQHATTSRIVDYKDFKSILKSLYRSRASLSAESTIDELYKAFIEGNSVFASSELAETIRSQREAHSEVCRVTSEDLDALCQEYTDPRHNFNKRISDAISVRDESKKMLKDSKEMSRIAELELELKKARENYSKKLRATEEKLSSDLKVVSKLKVDNEDDFFCTAEKMMVLFNKANADMEMSLPASLLTDKVIEMHRVYRAGSSGYNIPSYRLAELCSRHKVPMINLSKRALCK